MQMRHALLPVFSAVDDDAVAGLVDLEIFDELADDSVRVTDDGFVLVRQFVDPRDVFFRDDEHMHRRLRLDIVDGDDEIVLINLSGRNFPGDDLTKNAVAQFTQLLCPILPCLAVDMQSL